MDIELKRRLNERNDLQTFQYLKEYYCDDAELFGNFLSVSKKTSLFICLKDIMKALCGSEEVFDTYSASILSSYSAETFVFKGKEVGSVKYVDRLPSAIKGNIDVHLFSKKNREMSVSELVLAVFGCYPEKHFHLFSVLLQDSGNVLIPLSTKLFPPHSFNTVIASRLSQEARYSPTTPLLYSQFLAHTLSSKTKDVIEVTPFEFFMLRFLRCLSDLTVNPFGAYGTSTVDKSTFGITAVQLFIHIMNYLIDPNTISKSTIGPSTLLPSSQRPDFFFLSVISEIWLNRDSCVNDWNRLLNTTTSLPISILPNPSLTMISCLTTLILYLQTNPNLKRDGTSEHLDSITPSLFFFFAKYFTFFEPSISSTKSPLQLSDLVKCWCTFIKPWKQENEISSYRLFICRHYMFYRGLLILLVRSITRTSLSKQCIHDIIFEVANTFHSSVLAILNSCDVIVETAGIQGQIEDPTLHKQGAALLSGMRILGVQLKSKVSMSSNKREVYLCLMEKIATCLRREEESKNEEVVRKWARILEFDENSFIATCKKMESPTRQGDDSGSFQGIFADLREFLFNFVATQRQREPSRLLEPIHRFENKMLTRGLIWLTMWLNSVLLTLFGRGQELEGVDWELYFNEPEHVMVNLRWFADYRNLVVYWVGMQL